MKNHINDILTMLNKPDMWDFSGAKKLFAGVDVGTFKVSIIVVDESGRPRAATLERAEVVKSGMIIDYMGAVHMVRQMLEKIRGVSPLPLDKGATSYPPQTEAGNINTTKYILETVGLEVLNMLDEPTAANLVLGMENAAILDVGGGTTGIAVIKGGKVVYSNDEATGGVHLTLVLAGALNISYEDAENLKMGEKSEDIVPIVKPVIDKISTIAAGFLKPFEDIDKVCLVGGTCELKGLSGIVAKNLGLETFRPAGPQVITPFGIALSCIETKVTQ
jgi:ethanolamine utilization protein EutJ